MRKLNKRKVAWIVRELGKGELPTSQIAKQQDITVRWAKELLKRYEQDGYLPVPGKPGPTPKPILSAEIELVKWFKGKHGSGAVNLEKIMHREGIYISHNRIHSVLKSQGLANNEPKKQMRRKWVRFERKHSNSLWQTDWVEINGLHIIAFIDDASRLIMGVGVFGEATADNAVLVLNQAVKDLGVPKQLMSDHGTQFMSNMFRECVEGLGIEHIKARVKHPQTNGKIERWFGTLKQMLKHFKDLDYTVWFYNNERPHMSLEKADGTLVTPIEAFRAKRLKRGEECEEKSKSGS
ncbi:MAG: DDE-type integrase/transposase/recombinase [Candidatus Diapherotrites archaeon]